MKGKTDNWMGVTAAAAAWGISTRRVRTLCESGLLPGAEKPGGRWRIPSDAPRPMDGRSWRGLEIRPEWVRSFRTIDGLRDELARRRPLSAGERRRLQDEFTVEYTHESNAIEGNTLTLSETALVLQGVTIAQKPLKDHLEAIGHRDAFRYLCERVSEKAELDEWFVRELHSLVLADRPEDRGRYRRISVRILGATHTSPEPLVVPDQMRALLARLKTSRKHPVEKAALFHILFEAIHPFVDGNGRTGRLLLNFLLMRHGYPPINVKFADRRRYYEAFTSYHRDGDDGPMVRLVAEYLDARLRDILARIASATNPEGPPGPDL
ncbi:MAG: Fic family protein [Kiritimatiellae bacterium]|nr:Fic family protein [Kiritimatiellia bacterium]